MSRIAKQMVKERSDFVGSSCLKNAQGEIVVNGEEIIKECVEDL